MAKTKPRASDLEPCPFCGKKAENPVELFNCSGAFNFIHRCSILGSVKLEGSLPGITKAWNTRKG